MSKLKVKQSLALCAQSSKLIHKKGLPRRLAPPTRGRRPREEVRVLWGQSLFEVIFALAVASLVMVGIVSLAATSVRNSTFARNTALSTRLAQEVSEWLREQRDANDWSVFSSYTNAGGITYCLQTLGSSFPSQGVCGAGAYVVGTSFTREANLRLLSSSNPDDTVEAIITVEWSDAQGLHETRTTAQFTSWQTP